MPSREAATTWLSLLLVVLGIVILVQTFRVGGEVGYLLGGLFVLAGALRAYLVRLSRSR